MIKGTAVTAQEGKEGRFERKGWWERDKGGKGKLKGGLWVRVRELESNL